MIGFASAAHAPRSCSRCGGAGASGSPCLCAGCAQLLRELDLEIGRGVPGGPSVTSLDGATRQAVLTAYHGKRVQCSLAQYPVIRPRLIQAVQFLVAERDEAAAERVMLEVLRLDVHGLPEGTA